MSYVGYSPILYAYTPDHQCHIPDNFPNDMKSKLIPLDENQSPEKCLMYHPESIEQENKSTIPCIYGYEYNLTGLFSSVTTQFDWVCEESWKPNFAQSMFFAGAICGTLIFGWISDNFGRFWTVMLSYINIMIMGMATPFSNGFETFAALRFLTGLSFPTFYMCIYMLALEYVSISKRSMVGNLSLAIGLPIGGCIQAWILKAVGDWITFHHILFSQTFLMLFAPL